MSLSIFSLSLLLATCLSTTLAFVLCFLTGALSLSIAVLGIIFLCIGTLCFYLFLKRKINLNISIESRYTKIIVFLFLLFCYRQFFWIYFFKDGRVFTLNPNNLGDLPLHITYMMNFISDTSFWPQNPIFSLEKLHYPLGIDFFSALFLKLQIPMATVLPILGFVFGLLALWALLLWGGGFTVAGFLFSGGFAGFTFFYTKQLQDYQAPLAWKNLALSLLVPQRGFLYALPVGLFLLYSWQKRFFEKKSVIPIYIEGLFWGLMPLFHFHTFIFLSWIWAYWALWTKRWREALILLAIAFLPASIETWFLTEGFTQASIIHWKPGWMIEGKPIIFLLANWGLFGPLVFWGLYNSHKTKNNDQMGLALSALSFWSLLFLISFAPWEWDNTKLMIWCYLVLLKFVYDTVFISRLFYEKIFLAFVLFFSGFLSVYSQYHAENRGVEIAERAELETVCSMLKKIPARGIFAATQTYNHPVAMCGQSLVAGYSGHLWSHGIKAQAVEGDLKALMQGVEKWKELASRLKVRYIFWGPREERDFANSQKPWTGLVNPLVQSSWGTIYDLESIR